MFEVWKTTNCAMFELNNISHLEKPADIIQRTVETFQINGQRPPFINFSGVVEVHEKAAEFMHTRTGRTDNYGQALADFIVENKLGEVVASPGRVNPLSSNVVKIWIWSPDWTALLKQYGRQPASV